MKILKKMKEDKEIVVIFGAGAMGKLLYFVCKNHRMHIAGFCDNSKDKQGTYIFNEIPVFSIDDLVNRFDSDKMVVLISIKDIASAVEQLQVRGIIKWYGIHQLLDIEELFSGFTYSEQRVLGLLLLWQRWHAHYYYDCSEKLNLYSLDFVITERCSLRCRECCNLMQYYSSPKDFSFRELQDELMRVVNLYHSIFELRIIGGEPFMNRAMSDILRYAAQFKSINSICIYTNASIMPSEEMINMISECGNIWFSISNYGNLSKHLHSLINELKRNNIYYQITNDIWTSCSSFEKHCRSDEENRLVYESCCVRDSVTLLGGKIYPCPFIANGINLRALPKESNNFVDIMGEDVGSIKKMLKKLHMQESYSLCDYCKGRPEIPWEKDYVTPHEQVDTPLPYLKYT